MRTKRQHVCLNFEVSECSVPALAALAHEALLRAVHLNEQPEGQDGLAMRVELELHCSAQRPVLMYEYSQLHVVSETNG